MSNPLKAFLNLPPKTRLTIGIAFLAWGTAGLYIVDSTEKKLGFEPTKQDREALEAVVPRVVVVDREEGRGR